METFDTKPVAARAWLFAGHGSQYPGMGRGFDFDAAPVRTVFTAAQRACGLPLRELSQRGSEHELRRPAVLEPLLLAFSLAYAALLRARGHRPAAVAGYSAGLLPALVCAGVLDLESAFTLAVRRGALLETVVDNNDAMLAAHGVPVALMLACLQSLPQAAELDVAGWNSPVHLTLAGPRSAVRAAAAALVAQGAKTLEVPVAGAWHSRRVAGISRRCAAITEGLAFQRPRVPVYSSVSALREDDPQRLRWHVAEQLEAPVYWHATLANLCTGEGVREVFEVSCGRTLAGLQGVGRNSGVPAVVFTNLFKELKADYA